MTFSIIRQQSRFARGKLKNALGFVQNHADIRYATEDAAFLRVCEEVSMLAAKYRVHPAMRAYRHDSTVVIPVDEVGVVYVVRDHAI